MQFYGVEFIFENKKSNDYRKGSVKLEDCAIIDIEYRINGVNKRMSGNLNWWINGLGIVMLDDNKGDLSDDGDQYVEIKYFDKNLQEKKRYLGFIQSFDDFDVFDRTLKSIRNLYEFTDALLEETEYFKGNGDITISEI